MKSWHQIVKLIFSWFSRWRYYLRVRSTAITTTEPRKIAAILRLIDCQRHAPLVYSIVLRNWTSVLWSIDTCQNKVFPHQYRVPISQLKIRARRDHVLFLKLTADQVLRFSIGSRAHARLTYRNQGWV